MIPAQISEVGWSEIEALVELKRAEDDTIEFKRSFKGGSDYTDLNEGDRKKSLDALAREILAFLNTRGGDLVVGIAEDEDGGAQASSIFGVEKPEETAERISRALAALIEPAQTNLTVRPVVDPTNEDRGVIVIRVQASLRAPHRSKRTLAAYVRRGSESVPMAMDEIQDLTNYRTRIRLEQQDLLDRQFTDFHAGKFGQREVGPKIVQLKTVLFPFIEQSIEINDAVLSAFRSTNPPFYDAGGGATSNNVAFRSLNGRWKPMLRGKFQEEYDEFSRGDHSDIQFAAKTIKENGICSWDFGAIGHQQSENGFAHFDWILGYFSEICGITRAIAELVPNQLPAVLRVGVRFTGDVQIVFGRGMWRDNHVPPADKFLLPDFPLNNLGDLDTFFRQCQTDFCSLFHVDFNPPYSWAPPDDGADS